MDGRGSWGGSDGKGVVRVVGLNGVVRVVVMVGVAGVTWVWAWASAPPEV